MLRLVADENLNNDIIRGLIRREAGVDIVRIQDVGLSGADEASILEWAAEQGRLVVPHDVSRSPGMRTSGWRRDNRCPGSSKSARA